MQRAGGGVGFLVAEEHAGAAHGRHFQAHVGEGGGAALIGLLQVHHERGHALAAALEDGGRAGFAGVEVVVVRAVLGAGRIAQDLQAFAKLHRPAQQRGNALLEARDDVVLAALEEHALAGAVDVEHLAAGARLDRERARQPHPRGGNQPFALFRRYQIAEHDDARMPHGLQHLHAAVARVDVQRRAFEVGAGHLSAPRPGHFHVGKAGLELRQRQVGGRVLPAGRAHRGPQRRHRMPRRELRHQPFPELRTDRLRHIKSSF